MKKIKIGDKENDLLYWILIKTYEHGWDSCIGGHDESNKKEVKKYEADRKLILEIIKKLDN